ncbi:hypothetical protein [Candidatus Ruminimicrobiellum ovillum]|uniref:hypothetical protein n=1 Tax=Candidatus Ruminimicrobiellum ovillum TaxID=1947927 RepID=UPI0035593BCC
MNIKNLFAASFFLFLSVSAFAGNKTVVFFAESFDGVSAKVIQKIESSDKFCLAVAFDEDKYIKKEIQNLIVSHKIEPVLNIVEPYFPLISSQININSSDVFDKTDVCKDILFNYKKTYRTAFERNKHGLYLKGAALNDDVLELFYKNNILWTMAKNENENQRGLFIKNGVALFVPYKNFTTSETKIKQWFDNINNVKFVPIILTASHTKNEKFMLALVNFVNKNSGLDVELPINAAFYGYNSKTIKNNILLEKLSSVPKENVLKLYLADKEIKNYGKKQNEEVYTILCDELSNMYSYNVINGIINNKQNSIKLFDISYTNIFRMLNKKAPSTKEIKYDLSDTENTDTDNGDCKFTKNNNSIIIDNESNIFTTFSVEKNNEYISFKTDADLNVLDSIDIYIDMNSIAYTGSQKMLKPVNAFFVPENSWEFAIRITKQNIYIYKYLSSGAELIETIKNEAGNSSVKVSANILKGNPYNWNYQTVAIKDGEVSDFIENKEKKEKMFNVLPLQIKMYNYID